LGDLASRGRGIRPVIWEMRRAARLACPSTCVAAHDAPGCEPLDVLVIGAAGRDVLEELAGVVLREARCVRHHLGKLAPGDRVVRPEGAVGIAGDNAARRQAVYIWVSPEIGAYVAVARGACR